MVPGGRPAVSARTIRKASSCAIPLRVSTRRRELWCNVRNSGAAPARATAAPAAAAATGSSNHPAGPSPSPSPAGTSGPPPAGAPTPKAMQYPA